MLFFTSLIEKDLYEGDVVYSGGTVEYTGEVVHKGLGYHVEKATIALSKYSFVGYMKRFKMGNAVLCGYKLKENTENYKQYRGMTKTLRLNDIEDDAIFVFRAIREYFLIWLSILMIVFFIGFGKCIDGYLFYGYGINTVYMSVVFLIAVFIMKYLKKVCKARLPYGYVPRPSILEILRRNHRPFEVSDLEDDDD